MSTLRTAGELRSFLTDILVDVRNSKIDANKANAIAKVAAQINESLKTEVSTALQLERMGKAVPGAMLIGATIDVPAQIERAPVVVPAAAVVASGKVWCDQCESRVTSSQANGCVKAHCKAKEVA